MRHHDTRLHTRTLTFGGGGGGWGFRRNSLGHNTGAGWRHGGNTTGIIPKLTCLSTWSVSAVTRRGGLVWVCLKIVWCLLWTRAKNRVVVTRNVILASRSKLNLLPPPCPQIVLYYNCKQEVCCFCFQTLHDDCKVLWALHFNFGDLNTISGLQGKGRTANCILSISCTRSSSNFARCNR